MCNIVTRKEIWLCPSSWKVAIWFLVLFILLIIGETTSRIIWNSGENWISLNFFHAESEIMTCDQEDTNLSVLKTPQRKQILASYIFVECNFWIISSIWLNSTSNVSRQRKVGFHSVILPHKVHKHPVCVPVLQTSQILLKYERKMMC